MTYVPLPNVLCIAGLALGALLIFGADATRAEMRDCTEEETAALDSDPEVLPIICEAMIVRAKRPDNPNERVARLEPPHRYDIATLMTDESRQRLAETSWFGSVTN